MEEISKLVTNLKKLGLSDEIISGFAKSFGTDGLDWLRKARGLNLSSEVITNLSKLDGFADKMDEILELIKKSSRSADEVADCIIKHGDKAFDAIRKYGDDAVDAIIKHGDEAARVIDKYGDDAVDGLKKGKTPEEIEKELGNTGGNINLKPKDLMDELANSGVKYNPEDVIMVTKMADGKLVWLETGNSQSGLTHILERHTDDFASQGITDIPQLLNKILKTTPINTGSNTNGLFADFVLDSNTYRMAYGTNGYIVSFYPID